MIIHDYRRVFKITRRMHTIDPTRPAGEGLNKMIPPAGIPVRGIAYAVCALVISLLLWRLPLVGVVFGVWPWWIRHIVLPVVIAGLMMRAEPDGRSADLLVFAVLGWAWYRLREWKPAEKWEGKVRWRWDTSDVVLHRGGRIRGPATATFRVPVSLNDRWDGWYAEHDPDQGEPRTVAVRSDQTLRVRP